MDLLVCGKDLIKRYEPMWKKISCLSKKEFNSKPIYKNKYIKNKANLYDLPFLNAMHVFLFYY